MLIAVFSLGEWVLVTRPEIFLNYEMKNEFIRRGTQPCSWCGCEKQTTHIYLGKYFQEQKENKIIKNDEIS